MILDPQVSACTLVVVRDEPDDLGYSPPLQCRPRSDFFNVLVIPFVIENFFYPADRKNNYFGRVPVFPILVPMEVWHASYNHRFVKATIWMTEPIPFQNPDQDVVSQKVVVIRSFTPQYQVVEVYPEHSSHGGKDGLLLIPEPKGREFVYTFVKIKETGKSDLVLVLRFFSENRRGLSKRCSAPSGSSLIEYHLIYGLAKLPTDLTLEQLSTQAGRIGPVIFYSPGDTDHHSFKNFKLLFPPSSYLLSERFMLHKLDISPRGEDTLVPPTLDSLGLQLAIKCSAAEEDYMHNRDLLEEEEDSDDEPQAAGLAETWLKHNRQLYPSLGAHKLAPTGNQTGAFWLLRPRSGSSQARSGSAQALHSLGSGYSSDRSGWRP
jgi:hypothetical protein